MEHKFTQPGQPCPASASGTASGHAAASAGASSPVSYCRVLLVRLDRQGSADEGDPAARADHAPGRDGPAQDVHHAVPMGQALDAVLALLGPGTPGIHGISDTAVPGSSPAGAGCLVEASGRLIGRHLQDHPAGADWLSASLAVFMGCGGREGPFRPIWAAMQLFNMLAAAAERGVEYVCAVAARDWPVPCSCGAFWQTVRPEKDVRLALRDTAAPEA